MKIFANKNIWKKIVIVLLVIVSFSFIAPEPVAAGIGGELMEPICDFLVGLGDGFLNIAHSLIIHQGTSLIRVNLNDTAWDIVRILVTAVAFFAAIAVACALTAGGAMAVGAITGTLESAGMLITATSAIMANIIPILVGGVYFGAKAYSNDAFENEVALPLYSISPEAIFSNKIPLFDVNFFNPSAVPFEYQWIQKKQDVSKWSQMVDYSDEITHDGEYTVLVGSNDETAMGNHLKELLKIDEESDSVGDIATFLEDYENAERLSQDEIEKIVTGNSEERKLEGGSDLGYRVKANGETYYIVKTKNENLWWSFRDNNINNENNSNSTPTPTPTSTVTDTNVEGADTQIYSFSHDLQNVVAEWYKIIRMLAIVGMMSVLVYIGIRIVISSTAPQKAKYKQLLGDWLVGMLLLFTMHYIMYFANTVVDKITGVVSSVNPMGQTALIQDDKTGTEGKIQKELQEYGIKVTNTAEDTPSVNNSVVYKDSKTGNIEWHTDLMGHIRIALQANKKDNEAYIGYTLMFLVMIFYTISFCITYIKRVVYMAFLTIIAPLVALTYPIDKVNDGSAQGFNYWFKEYIFNLLLQPMHLLIYTILVSSAVKLAASNWIYSLVALGFILAAEKIVRAMFNFSKAHTPGVFAGPVGAAVTLTGMRFLFGHGPKGGALPKGTGKNSGAKDEDGKPITAAGSEQGPMGRLSSLFAGGKAALGIGDAPNTAGDNNTAGGNLAGALVGSQSRNSSSSNINGSTGLNLGAGALGALGASKQNEIKSQAKKSGFRRAISDVRGMYGDAMKQKFKRSLQNAQPAKKLARVATGAAAGAAFGMVGLASGIASGELKNVAQVGGFATIGGYKLGAGGYGLAQNALTVDGLSDEFERSYYGADEYKRRKAAENQAKDKYNEEFIRTVQNKKGLSRKEAQDWIEEKTPIYRNARIDDINDMINIENTIGKQIAVRGENGSVEARQMDADQAIGAYQMEKLVGNISDKDKRVNRIQDIMHIDRDSAINIDNARAAYANQRDGVKADDIKVSIEQERQSIAAERKSAEENARKVTQEEKKQQRRVKSAQMLERRKQQMKERKTVTQNTEQQQTPNITRTQLEGNIQNKMYDKYDLKGNNNGNKA